ncbi:MAG: 1,4-dihydroxy-6-naphthoate synthase [Kiritimatiellales bacterium]|nr:1,4-dihydroxy-6-naphthoate synthase [Kiritimatiellales bacterium]
MKLSVAYSPCPNDTFMFYGLAKKIVDIKDFEFEIRLHDIETLNRKAFDRTFKITKLSFHAWLLLKDRYRLLRCGAALGHGCGPLIVTRKEMDRSELSSCRIAVPGEYTTGNLLLSLWAPEARNRSFVPFNRIMDMVENGEADAGVIIHEGRFILPQRKLHCLVDLGDWWEKKTGCPTPLGCIAARRSLDDDVTGRFEDVLESSIHYALLNPEKTNNYVRSHAQELKNPVIHQHIQTYVNPFTLELGDEGHRAIAKLEELARAAGVIP